MSGLELLADTGPVAALLGVLGYLARGMLSQVLTEVKALRGELAKHAAEDSARFDGIKVALQQRWAAQTPRA